MEWFFASVDVLEEYHSGYSIKLIEGSWKNPIQIKPNAPDSMGFAERAKYLRCGFEFIRAIEKQNKSASKGSLLSEEKKGGKKEFSQHLEIG